MKASVILNPSESKRLIAKGVARLPEVKQAMQNGKIIIALGSTNGFVAEELLGEVQLTKIEKERFIAGFNGRLNNYVPSDGRLSEVVLINSEKSDCTADEIKEELQPDDVFIKGGNALDPEGTVGVIVASRDGGTVGKYMRYVVARGVNLVIPIGLEKAVHTKIAEISKRIGNMEFGLTMGAQIGLWPLHGRVVTEIEALGLLADVNAFQIGAGGIGGAEGSVILGIRGEEKEVGKAFQIVKEIKGEPPLSPQGALQ